MLLTGWNYIPPFSKYSEQHSGNSKGIISVCALLEENNCRCSDLLIEYNFSGKMISVKGSKPGYIEVTGRCVTVVASKAERFAVGSRNSMSLKEYQQNNRYIYCNVDIVSFHR